jgi:hypothetical protein
MHAPPSDALVPNLYVRKGNCVAHPFDGDQKFLMKALYGKAAGD